mmetsp:Transcript_14976/g.29230  ORF Transcript_14976/g.29230 Transcript_14976/m.29230 type:complete len:82 (+) Transcript_14976:592-837(+)
MIRNHVRRCKRQTSHWTRHAFPKPSCKRSSLISVPVSAHHWVYEDLVRDWAANTFKQFSHLTEFDTILSLLCMWHASALSV